MLSQTIKKKNYVVTKVDGVATSHVINFLWSHCHQFGWKDYTAQNLNFLR